MANRQSPKQPISAQSLISNLQSQLDSDGQLRASLTDDLADINAGSNDHLVELFEVASDIEDAVNELLGDLSLLQSALNAYGLAAASSERSKLDLCDTVVILSKLLPDHIGWDRRIHEHFKRLHAMKRSTTH